LDLPTYLWAKSCIEVLEFPYNLTPSFPWPMRRVWWKLLRVPDLPTPW